MLMIKVFLLLNAAFALGNHDLISLVHLAPVVIMLPSGVPRNFVRGGGSTNSVEDRENGDLGAVAP